LWHKNKNFIRISLVFFGVMLLATFFSRSVMTLLTPKVTYTKPSSQTFSNEITAEAETWLDDTGEVLVSAVLPLNRMDELRLGQMCEFQYAQDGKIVIGEYVRVTDMAVDTASQMNIRIVREAHAS